MVYKLNLSFIRQKTRVRGTQYTYYFIKAMFSEQTVKNICNDKPLHECTVNVIITRKNIPKLLVRLYELMNKIEQSQEIKDQQLKQEILETLQEITKMIKE